MQSSSQFIEAKLTDCAINLRKANYADLEAINQLISSAINTWNLADRVKRISLPLYYYDEHDLVHLQILIAETEDLRIVGVSALEPIDKTDDEGRSISIFHGLYVDPDLHRKGVGTALLEATEILAQSIEADSLLVKARPEAVAFFQHRGFEELAVKDHSREYPHRLRKYF